MGGEPVADFYDLIEVITLATSPGALVPLLAYARDHFAGERRAYLERLVTARRSALARQPVNVAWPAETGRQADLY